MQFVVYTIEAGAHFRVLYPTALLIAQVVLLEIHLSFATVVDYKLYIDKCRNMHRLVSVQILSNNQEQRVYRRELMLELLAAMTGVRPPVNQRLHHQVLRYRVCQPSPLLLLLPPPDKLLNNKRI